MQVKILKVSDSLDVAVLHMDAFKKFFLTSLGLRFLKVFYKAILRSNESVAVGIYENNALNGFAIGTTNVEGFYGKLAKNNLIVFAFAAIPNILRPSVLVKLLSSLKNNNEGLKGCCLLSICVTPSSERSGLGSMLVRAFEDEIRSIDIKKYSLTTDADSNEKANAFYINNGFHLVNEIKKTNRILNVYTKEL